MGWDNATNKGIICEGVSINRHLDYSSPEIIYLKALEKAIDTVIHGLSDRDNNEIEVIEEFTAHWRFASQIANPILSFIDHQDSIAELQPVQNPKYNWPIILHNPHDNTNNTNYQFKKHTQDKSQVTGKAFYLPIRSRTLPPEPNTTIIEWWKSLLETLPEDQVKSLKNIARRDRSKTLWMLGSIIIDESKHGWFCIKFENTSKENLPIYPSCDFNNWNAKAYPVELHNKEYLKPRGGATLETTPSIAIIGCGSIGAEIAKQLVCSGVENIELIDSDKLEIANIYRHYLSSGYIGLNKSEALACQLSSSYPYANIISSRLNYLKECLDPDFLNRTTGIIVATGSPTDERYFNEMLFKRKSRPWVIYTWVEGHGFGGHAIYVHNTGKGCLNCLYRDQHGNKSLESVQNFLKSEQKIAIDLSGCGTHFLPYSHADAIQSAILATRLTIQALNGQLYKSCRTSWKSSFIPNSTLETSHRYKNFNNSLNIEDLIWDECDVCN